PGGAVNTVGAIPASCGYNFGVSPIEPRIRSGWAAAMPPRSGLVRVPTPGTPCTALPRYEGWLVEPSGRAAATIRDCRPSAHRASSWSPESPTVRCGSAGSPTGSGVPPATLWARRVDGPGSAAAASRAHDSSGLRSFPSTPAPAIWVVGVTSDWVDALVPDP